MYGLRRLSSTGSPEAGFPANVVTGTVNKVFIQPDGKIIFGGAFSFANNRNLARVNTDGSRDSAFIVIVSTNLFDAIYDIDMQPDGKIIVGGRFGTINGNSSSQNIARLTAEGVVDQTFHQVTDGLIYAVNPLPNGKLLIGGNISYINGVFRGGLARLNADGSLDNTFTANTTGGVWDLFVQPDGKIVAGGQFTKGRNLKDPLERITPTPSPVRILTSMAMGLHLVSAFGPIWSHQADFDGGF